MAEKNKPEYAPGNDDIVKFTIATSQKERQSVKETLEKLAGQLGYRITLSYLPKLKVALNENINQFLDKKEDDIAKSLAKNKKGPVSMDKNAARCIILMALCTYNNVENNPIKKIDVCRFRKYNDRTMRNQYRILKDIVFDSDSHKPERKIFLELRSELEQFAS